MEAITTDRKEGGHPILPDLLLISFSLVFAGKIRSKASMVYLGLIGTISPRSIIIALDISNPFLAIVRFRSIMG